MPKPTPCTNCGRPGNEKFCGACGSNQSQRFPENDLAEFLIANYLRAKVAFDALEDGADTKATKRIVARYEAARSRLVTCHALLVEVDRAFALPTGMTDGAPELTCETTPNEED